MMMESMANVECRAGFHCAGLIHQSLNTTDCGGTLRLSMGQTSQADDVVAACEGIQRMAEIL
jgi:selenocysteine lyase/cysteine desulfurase